MTIICFLPSLPIEIFWHLLAPFQRHICAYATTRGGRPQLAEWSSGPSDIEGKMTRVGATECGRRTSFNRTREAGRRDEVEGGVANTLKLQRNRASQLAKTFGVG
jgi:hypothetical protein